MKILTRYGLGAMATILSLGIAETATAEISEKEKQEIVNMVIDRIKSDPSIALDMLSALKSSTQENKDEAKITMKSAPRMIELVEGNPHGDVVIMDFADYGCSACNEQSIELIAAANADSRIKIVLRDLPRSGDDGLQASIDLLAAASAQKDWKKIRQAYLSGQIKPEMRIIALAEGQSYPSNADRELAKIALEKNGVLAERTGIKNGPAAIMVIGGIVQLMPTPVTAKKVSDLIEELQMKAQ